MYCVFADVHANLEALEAVLGAARDEGVDSFLFLGDVVGYGPDPNSCTRLVREVSDAAVCGNHDLAAIGRQDINWFNPVAQKAIRWTSSRLEPDVVEYIDSLPSELLVDSLLLTHGSPLDPIHEYLLDPWAAAASFHDRSFEIGFVGHSHIPLIFRLDPGEGEPGEVTMSEPEPGSTLNLEEGNRYIINPGGVGQPRDGNPQAAFGLYDPGTMTLQFRRIAYPVEETQRKMEAAGLPRQLIERLSRGG